LSKKENENRNNEVDEQEEEEEDELKNICEIMKNEKILDETINAATIGIKRILKEGFDNLRNIFESTKKA
jgi:hypothetical protein